MLTVNNLVLGQHTILDLADAPLTGLTYPPDVDFILLRQSGTTFVAATEVLSFGEIGATGHYYFSFTPENTGLYTLRLRELSVLTGLRQPLWTYEVLPAGAVYTPTWVNAYCAETDVERYAGLALTATSSVTSTEAAGFAEERATILTSLLAGWGVTITPATVVAGSRLEDLLRAANAIGAAVDSIIAWFGQIEPAKMDKAAALEAMWIKYIGGMVEGQKVSGYLEAEAKTGVSLSTSHILSGDTTARAAENAPQDIGLQFKMGDTF